MQNVVEILKIIFLKSMTEFMKAKFNQSEGKINIEKYRITAQIILQNNITKIERGFDLD